MRVIAMGVHVVDVLARPVAPAFEHLDHLLPGDEQVLGRFGADDLVAGCRTLVDRGIGCVAATRGAVVASIDAVDEIPAFPVAVVDTTGCGDAFPAGFLRGLAFGSSRRDAAVLGCAAAGLVAQCLGSDHGEFDLAAADAFSRD